MKKVLINAGFLMLLLACPAMANDLERWFESDSLLPPAHSAEMVNEGELVFLQQPPAQAVHHHQNNLVISQQSLDTGWVWMEQCHDDLDKVSQAQILFRRKRTRELKIVSSKHITRSWVEKNTVQLRNVGEQAQICITAWTRALVKEQDGSYRLRNGPFMRRFLDGYYPMHVSMEIDYSNSGLRLDAIQPQAQQGFVINQNKGHVSLDAWFEGRLMTELLFRYSQL